MLTKGQTITLNITDMNHLGYGLGRADGMVVFVQGAVPLDKVRCVTVSYTHLTLPTILLV